MSVKEFEERKEGFNKYLGDFGETISIDPTLSHNILCLVEAAKGTNGDVWIIVDGEEGSGKTTLTCQLARLLDKSFTEKKIEFNPEDLVLSHFRGLPEIWDPKIYNEGGYTNKPWEVLDLDESAGLDRKKTMSAGSVEFTGFVTQSRQLHKIVFCTLPSVHILNGYIAEHRANCLISCYKHERSTMGFFKYYSKKHLKLMFSPKMHTQKLYPKKPAFRGRFSSKKPFDMSNYDRKKAAALNAYRKVEGVHKDDDKKSPFEIVQEFKKNRVLEYTNIKLKCSAVSVRAMSAVLEMDRRDIVSMLKKAGIPYNTKGDKENPEPEPEPAESEPEPGRNNDTNYIKS